VRLILLRLVIAQWHALGIIGLVRIDLLPNIQVVLLTHISILQRQSVQHYPRKREGGPSYRTEVMARSTVSAARRLV
jgi:hypothetical protein